MFKRIGSTMLVILILLSIIAVSASAKQSNNVISKAIASDKSNISETSEGQVIYFDLSSTPWKDFETVYCHVWACDGTGEWPTWESKAEKCDYDEVTKIASYDLSKTGNQIESGAKYACIFSDDNGSQTYNLVFGEECIGDTVVCTDKIYENPTDSPKYTIEALWKNKDNTKFGPELIITSIGNVIGTCCPSNNSRYDIFVSFLKDTLDNARSFSGKNDQKLIDDIIKDLPLSDSDTSKVIAESGIIVDWKPTQPETTESTQSKTEETKEPQTEVPADVAYVTISDVNVIGTIGSKIEEVEATITYYGEINVAQDVKKGTNVSSFFTNLPKGLTVELSEDVKRNSQQYKVVFKGTPGEISQALIKGSFDYYDVRGTYIGAARLIENSNAKYNITDVPSTNGGSTTSNNATSTNASTVKTGTIELAVLFLIVFVLASGVVIYFRKRKEQ